MKSLFEEMGGIYRQVGDYFIPNLVLPDDGDYQIGKYGRLRRNYLKEHRKILYTNYVVEGTLFKHLSEIDQACNERMEIIVPAMAKQLEADIEAGKVAHVIVKDMSRIGRDYLQTGFYTEVFFREHGVHFIAIANSVDSDDQNSNEFAPFLNIMNEWYLRDLSRKQRTAIRVKGESGKPTTNCAIYGYKKMPGDKYSWYIDEEAAEVVRRIFRLTIEGKGPYDIARILYDDKVETPAVYLGKQKKGVWKSKEEFPNPYNWSGYIVGQILSKPEYMGHTVNFRSHKQSYKDKNPVMNPKEEWLIFENTHEAIVDKETWELAQKL
ncbi:MAG: TnpV protein, partial [Clostridia bacterium]|nr:TnpV protein [Clostridia bacterium]